MADTIYGYAVDGAGGDDRQGHGALADVHNIARAIIAQGEGALAAWHGPGPMKFPVTRMRYDAENEWAVVWRTTGPGVECDGRECPGEGTAIEHLTALLTAAD